MDLHRPYAVWNVCAAPEFSLEPKTWWYPIVGSLDYRGFFSERDARKYADILDGKGFDVSVDGVEAYSTLGWFKDPLLNTFIHHDEAELAEILFHELAHQRVFVSGDTDFNEPLPPLSAKRACAAGCGQKLRALETILSGFAQSTSFDRSLTRDKLETFTTTGAPESQKRRRTALLHPTNFARKKTSWNCSAITRSSKRIGDAGHDEWFARANNARLNSVATYSICSHFRAFARGQRRRPGKILRRYKTTGEAAQS